MSEPVAGESKAPHRVLWVVGVALAVLVVVAIVAGTRPATQLDPATPEGTVQAYAQAAIDDDREAARALLHPDVLAECPQAPQWYSRPGSIRLAILDTEITGDRARVDVKVTETYGNGPFGGGESSWDDVFNLETDGGEWRVRTAPWPFLDCPGVGR